MHLCMVSTQLRSERTGISGERACWGQNHFAEVSSEEMSAFKEPSPCLGVSAFHAGNHKPTSLLCCHTGNTFCNLIGGHFKVKLTF